MFPVCGVNDVPGCAIALTVLRRSEETSMKAFGLMELETVAPRARADDVLDRMFNAAHYLCDRGPVLQHGHTFGLSANEKIQITQRRSRWQRPGEGLFLEWPT